MRFIIKRVGAIALLIIIVAASALASDWDRSVSLYNKGDYRAALANDVLEFQLKRYDRVELPLSHAIDLLEVQSPASAEIAGAWYTIGLSHYLANHYDKA